MSQHDYVIENQSGPNVRSDINSALSAIVTNNSGASAPTITFAYMWWPDTTSGWLKQRDAGNAAWIKRFPLGTGARVDVASAGTVNLTANAVSSDYVRITGTSTIRAITLEEGQKRVVLAGGAFTLTNSASLVISTNSDFVATDGDIFYLYGEAAGVVRVKADTSGTDLIRSTMAGAETVIKANNADVVTIGATGIKAGSYAPLSVTPEDMSQKITLGTMVATTSGTSIDITGIPSWVKHITLSFSGVSTKGTSNLLVQLGAGTAQVAGYSAAAVAIDLGSNITTYTAGFGIRGNTADTLFSGSICFSLMGNNLWTASGVMVTGAFVSVLGGSVTLSGVLDRIRITTVNGTDTYDAGSANILYEG